MKREFGAPLIENFLSRRDLRLVVDASGVHIPGHGTPTVIIVGRPQSPVGDSVLAVLRIRDEPGVPAEPAEGIVWRSIVEHFDDLGHEDRWTSTADLDRQLLARHPWSLTGGGAVELKLRIETSQTKPLGQQVKEIGFGAVTREDSAYMLGSGPHATRGSAPEAPASDSRR
jgi:hypothetical protein